MREYLRRSQTAATAGGLSRFERGANFADMVRVGLISDTHGLLRPDALEALKGCDQILHGGDVGDPFILNELGVIAPVTAVRGNIDYGAWAEELKELAIIEIEEVRVCVIHNLAELEAKGGAQGARVILFGHSHKPMVEERHGVLHVNPGSAGPRRFRLPISVGILEVVGTEVSAQIVEL
jgi:putative phosphoesterase